MKTEDIDEMLVRVRDYERTSFGIKFGADFPQFAETLSHSKEFKGLCTSQLAMGLIAMLTGKDEGADQLMAKNPMRDALMLTLYAGYKLGLREAEIHNLESVLKERTP